MRYRQRSYKAVAKGALDAAERQSRLIDDVLDLRRPAWQSLTRWFWIIAHIQLDVRDRRTSETDARPRQTDARRYSLSTTANNELQFSSNPTDTLLRKTEIITAVYLRSSKQVYRSLLVKFIEHNQNYYLKLDVSTSIRGLHQKKLVLLSSSGSRHDENRRRVEKAVLTRRLPVVSITGRTEYQLLLMKASDRGRNVKF